MNTTIAIFFLVLKTGSAMVVIPEPFTDKAKCEMEAAQVDRSHTRGPRTYGYCITVTQARKQP